MKTNRPLILNIDTALETAFVSVSLGESVLDFAISSEPKMHASFLHASIKNLLYGLNLKTVDIDCVAVCSGPGSYTGLRVGMASAKGLCYALRIPIIVINTLELMVLNASNALDTKSAYYCPMIDARRKEVYTALYDQELYEIIPPSALILQTDSFKRELNQHKVVFFGSGSLKFKSIQNMDNAFFEEILMKPESMAIISNQKFLSSDFESLATITPLYIKEFHTITKF